MCFNEDDDEFSIDEIDEDLRGRKKDRAILLKEIRLDVVEVLQGEYDNFDSFRTRLVTHYAVKKHMIQNGHLVWKRPPPPILIGHPEARFVPKSSPAVTI